MTHFGLPRIDLYVQSKGDATSTSQRTIWPRTGTSALVAQMHTQAAGATKTRSTSVQLSPFDGCPPVSVCVWEQSRLIVENQIIK